MPHAPPAGRPVRWPWIVLLVASICLACPLFLMAGIVLIGSEGGEDALISLFCAIPAFILVGTAILGGIMALRKARS